MEQPWLYSDDDSRMTLREYQEGRRADRDLDPRKWLLIVCLCLFGAMALDHVVNGGELDEKAKLGQKLFHSTLGSQFGTTSCGSCHNQEHAGSDGRAKAVGMIGAPGSPQGIVGPRKTPTVVNASNTRRLDVKKQFLDHRADNPLAQAIMPFSNPSEMGNQSIQDVANRFNRVADFRQSSQRAFGTATLTPAIIAAAIVSYENTLRSEDTPLSRYLGGDKMALSESEARGADLIVKAKCLECHRPPLFTTGRCAINGFAFATDRDIGLQKTTGNPAHRHAIKLPSWIDLAHRAPYMHNGELKRIDQVVEFYSLGGTLPGRGRDPQIDDRIKPQKWSREDKADIVACLTGGTLPYDRADLSPPGSH